MDMFNYSDGKLFCEEVDVNTIARECGTPVFVYSAGTVLDHYTKMKRAWETVPSMIFYAVKANSNAAILRLLVEHGAGMEVVSQGELYRCLRAGADPKKVLFTGVGKTVAEMEYALQHDIFLFIVESIPELVRLNEVAGRLEKKAQFAIRVNPDVDPHTHAHITTGMLVNKFGLDADTAVEAYRLSKELEHVSAIGIHMHIGSQLVSSEPYVEAVEKVRSVIADVRKLGIELSYYDLGGGMGVIYDEEEPCTADEIAGSLLPHLTDLNLKIIVEPGRFIVGNAGVLLTEVQYIKNTPLKKFIVVDAGMNDLIRPALYGAQHRILPTQDAGPEVMEADIVGPLCESADTFAKDKRMPSLEAGDYLAIMTAGAYASAMSSEYLSRRKCTEVLVQNDQFRVVREREDWDQLMENEVIPSFLSEPTPEDE
jgi:diaminopimelate decarboxylase